MRARQKTKGVIHFLGGAFAGAAPQVVYSLLLDILATAGYTVVSTPYAVTFKHLDCAAAVRQQFLMALKDLSADRSSSGLAPPGAPVLGVGHSLGALLHLIINSTQIGATAGNVVISYNNKQVTDAIPVPLGTIAPSLKTLRDNASLLPEGMTIPDAGALLRGAASFLPKELNAAGQISGAGLALEQMSSVLGEVGDGATEFSPTPEESRQLIRGNYDASRSPLLMVRMADDTIDQTTELARTLISANPPGSVTSLVLPGTHVTPCGGDIPWQPGPVFTPLDAIAQLGKAGLQADTRRLADAVIDYLDRVVADVQAAKPPPQLRA